MAFFMNENRSFFDASKEFLSVYPDDFPFLK